MTAVVKEAVQDAKEVLEKKSTNYTAELDDELQVSQCVFTTFIAIIL